MSFSQPKVVSPVEFYVSTNARDGIFKQYDNQTGEKSQLDGPLEFVILDSECAEYTGYRPDGDHYSSNHFKSGDRNAWVTIKGEKSGIILEGNPQDPAFKQKVKQLKPALKYSKLVFVSDLEGERLGVVRLTGTVLNAFINSTSGKAGPTINIDHNPRMTISVGKQVEMNSNLIYQFKFEFKPLGEDLNDYFPRFVAMDKKVQEWIQSRNQTPLAQGTANGAGVTSAEDQGQLVEVEDTDIDNDF